MLLSYTVRDDKDSALVRVCYALAIRSVHIREDNVQKISVICILYTVYSIQYMAGIINYLRVKRELVPVSASFTSMFRLASGVPKGTFSGMVTLNKQKMIRRHYSTA